jgi:FtsP/CotA-like multicopper oxidase with cupredoxin domain
VKPRRMMTRRDLLKLAGFTAVSGSVPAAASIETADYTLEIAPVSLELSRGHSIRTVGYNGQVPGPLLRFKEGKPVTVDVINRTARPEVVHWHGLFLPSEIDGAVEEGTPLIQPGQRARYGLTPRPAGFRWYHTHTMAMDDLSLGQYGGQHGLLMIETRDPGDFDQELFLVLHDWEGYSIASDDGSMALSYKVSTINGKVLHAGEPLRVRQGQRVLLHVLNSSPTETHWLSLPGHEMKVVALDGNRVPNAAPVPMLRLAPAERISALIDMNQPGVWLLAEPRKHIREAGMGVVVEYADQTGEARWQDPAELSWDYLRFAADSRAEPSAEPITIPLVFESKFRGHGAMEGWTINGKSYPDAGVEPLIRGQRYRLALINRSHDDHPLHLHRHIFELRRLGMPIGSDSGYTSRDAGGVMKDVVLVDAHTRADVEFVAEHPGPSLFHCHQQDHMDRGFMMLFRYA